MGSVNLMNSYLGGSLGFCGFLNEDFIYFCYGVSVFLLNESLVIGISRRS